MENKRSPAPMWRRTAHGCRRSVSQVADGGTWSEFDVACGCEMPPIPLPVSGGSRVGSATCRRDRRPMDPPNELLAFPGRRRHARVTEAARSSKTDGYGGTCPAGPRRMDRGTVAACWQRKTTDG